MIQRTISRTHPPLLISLPRLLTRLPEHDSNVEKLTKRLYQLEAGYAGEWKIDQYLQKINLPDSSIILTNVELALSPNHSFQIDTLLITKQTIFILEIKNIKGNLYFKSNPHHLLREVDGVETIMDCPLTQLEIAKENLSLWLLQRGIDMNVSGIVVLANNQCIVKEVPRNARLTYMKRLAVILGEINQMTAVYQTKEIQTVATLIKQNQVAYNIYPLCNYFRIDPATLKKGQLCSKCHQILFRHSSKILQCTYCNNKEPYNAERIVQDWFILISNSMNNKQCKDFLQLKSSNEAYYILNKLDLEKEGKSIATRYYWPNNRTLQRFGGIFQCLAKLFQCLEFKTSTFQTS